MPRLLQPRPVPLAILIGVFAQGLFLVRLSVPGIPVFDEVHYLPAARTLLALSHPANIEHPLLGKSLIALGMMIFGDTPFGWRVMSTLAATAVVVGVFAILQLATGRMRTATFGAALVLMNFTVFIQARIAMLDGFMAAFVVTGIAAFAWAMRRGGWGRWLFCAMLLGLAVGCKWAALPYAGFAGLAFLWLKREDPARFAGLATIPAALGFGMVAAASYVATFLPAFFYTTDPLTLARLIPFHAEMYARQTLVLSPHTYQSSWWTWPILLRPIWYLYESVDGVHRGILMIGNPVVMLGGLVAVAACLSAWMKTGARVPLAAAGLWLASVAIWALIPKSIGFYYYYYLSSIFLCIAIPVAFDHWRLKIRHWDAPFALLCFGMTLYFWPVLSAQSLADPAAFKRWAWFASWV